MKLEYDNYGLYINGKWVKGEDGSYEVINPYNEEVLGSVSLASETQVEQTISTSYNAIKEWQKLTSWERAEIISKIAQNLKENLNEIAKVITLETGKPIAQSIREVNLAIDQFVWFSEQTKRIEGKLLESRNPNTQVLIKYEPIGVVAAFSSWNFPILLSARKIAPSLAAGCPIIVRSTDVAPMVNMKLIEACHNAGLPNGMVSLICGSASKISPIIMKDDRVRKISLTGSTTVGQKLIEQSAQTLKKVTMELGGHAPVIIHDDADIKMSAILSANTKFANAGQVCVSPTRFYVHSSVIDEFCKEFVKHVKNIKLGNGLDADTTMGPLIHKKRLSEIESFIEHVHKTGGTILTGGKKAANFEKGFFFEPTVIKDLPNISRLLCDEIFGPIALIVSFDTIDEVLQKANNTNYALAAYTFTASLEKANLIANNISAGMLGINSFALAAAEIPFGGIKASGFGRESGSEGMYEYLNSKIITLQTHF